MGAPALPGRLRTVLTVQRPPFTGSRGETWIVEVRDRIFPPLKTCSVFARLQSVNIPRVWCDDAGEWIGPYSRIIPGVVVPASGEPYTLNSLGLARKKARELAGVLSGMLHPKFEEKNTLK